ncbi:MAG TPA: ATPase domain-containing protein [Verrucomicrobiae bacterium]|nr:ATPase domain-containing protein [Verrucomicrobiae bacterium]
MSDELNGMAPTGIPGLDHVLTGGLTANRLYLVQGKPGVGKTTLALQFLMEGVRRKEPGLYITLSETKEEIDGVAKSHGWDLRDLAVLELSAIEEVLAESKENTFFHPSELELNKTTQILLDEVERTKVRRVVLDSLSEFRLLAETALRYRRQMLRLKQYFAGKNVTVLLLDDCTGEASDLHLQSIAHGVISLDRLPVYFGIERRQIKVEKLRGVKFREGAHDYTIERGGLQVYPRLVAADHQRNFPEEPVSSGVEGFDQLMGGGLDRGTSTLFIGPAGCGKSTLAIQHAVSLAKRGEKSAVFIFDENRKTLSRRARAVGLGLEEQVAKEMIRIQQIDPAELSPGEFTAIVQREVEKTGVSMVIIDSLNGYLNSMPDERFLNLQLHELLSYLSQQGIVSILTLAQHGMIGNMQSPVDVTYLADAVVLLRFFEAKGKIHKAVSVVKKRSGHHESAIRELTMTDGKVAVGRPLDNYRGILTGVPSESTEREKTER